MRILVTGAAGFIGYHVSRLLLDRGDTVVGVDCLTPYYDVALKHARLAELGVRPGGGAHRSFRFHNCDVADPQALRDAVAGERFDAICHLAAQVGVRYSLVNPPAYVRSNLEGFVSVLELARHAGPQLKHLVFASSSSVYGGSRQVPFTTADPVDRPMSLYGATKRSNELMARSYSHLFGLAATGLRFFTVYGPWGRPDMAYWSFTRSILAGDPIPVFNGGELQRDFTYVGDIAAGVVRVLDRPPAAADGEPPFRLYNIGRGEPVHLLDFIRAIETATGHAAVLDMKPMQPGDMHITWADTTALEADHGYTPSVSLTEGVTAFVEWYLDYTKRPG